MIEVEIKLPINSRKELEEKLRNMGFTAESQEKETDIYLDNVSGDIRRQRQALRIRECIDLNTGKTKAQINFKGPKLDQVSAARTELETEIGHAGTALRILESLGFHTVEPNVTKTRATYRRDSLTACLDQIEALGTFLELEILAHTDTQYKNALKQIEEVLKTLGYSMKDTTRSSYLSMLQRN